MSKAWEETRTIIFQVSNFINFINYTHTHTHTHTQPATWLWRSQEIWACSGCFNFSKCIFRVILIQWLIQHLTIWETQNLGHNNQWASLLYKLFLRRVQLLGLKHEFLLGVSWYWNISLLACTMTLGSNGDRCWMNAVDPAAHASDKTPKGSYHPAWIW